MTARIAVVGLGPGDPELLTRKAWHALTRAEKIYTRTLQHPTLAGFPKSWNVEGFDRFYERYDSFDAVYEAIVSELLNLVQKDGRVVYAVPGDPSVGEATVERLRVRALGQDVEVELIHGVSFIEPCLAALELDALDGVFVADAHEVGALHHPSFPPHAHVLVGQIHSRMVASDVKLTLMNQYPEDHSVVLVVGAGTGDPQMQRSPLHDLDRRETFGPLTTLYLPPLERPGAFEQFQEIVAHLRAPEGCPWDREQTHSSLRQHLLEESYEALEALDRLDMTALEEELGDLLLQIVLQAQIATESGEFQMADVVAGINDKLVRRHPHVFGDVEVEDVGQVLQNWEHLKGAERDASGEPAGALAGVPGSLPALAQAAEYQSRAARLGFDWEDIQGVKDKIHEEIGEVEGAKTAEERSGEVGDLLFAVVNMARWLEVDPEAALREANQRFRRRFGRVEQQARATGQALEQMDMAQLDALWEAAKGIEG